MTEESRALVPFEQRTIEFYGDELLALMIDQAGKPTVYIPVRPICEHLGVDWSAQYRRINRDPVLAK